MKNATPREVLAATGPTPVLEEGRVLGRGTRAVRRFHQAATIVDVR
jgi:hypothetical protein